MKITFEGSYEQIVAEIALFVGVEMVERTAPVATRGSTKAEDDAPIDPVTNMKSKPKRAAKPRKSKEKVDETQPPHEDAIPEARSSQRRGKQTQAEKPKSTKKPESSSITDADLTKACSLAAEVIKPIGVKDLIHSFDVTDVGDLVGAQRQAFIDQVNEAMQ